MKIGVFDSGLGGLTILRAIQEKLPTYQYLYFGDTANLPYGDKTEEEIYELTKRAIEILFKRGALLVIVACNTASAESLRRLQDTFVREAYPDHRVLGVIVPTIEEIIERGYRRVLLIGTMRTITSRKYERELEKRDQHHVTLMSLATPELVPYIESGNVRAACDHIKNLLIPRVGEIDALVLGCTHYTVLTDFIRKEFPGIAVLSQDELIPAKLERYLRAHPELETRLAHDALIETIITGEAPGRSIGARG